MTAGAEGRVDDSIPGCTADSRTSFASTGT